MEKIAWGEIIMSIAPTGALDVMGTPLVELGFVKEDSMAINLEEGPKLQLFGTGHVLVDEVQQEDIINVAATLIGLEKATQFWEMGTGPTEGQVISLVNSDNWSVKFASKVVGSKTFEAPKCKIKATPVFSEKEGWSANLKITVLKGAAGYFYKHGTVSA